MHNPPSIEATLTRGERAAPFALSEEFETITGPTCLDLDIEEKDDAILFAETDVASGYTLRVGDLANRRSKHNA